MFQRLADRAQARDLDEHARDGRDRGQALRHRARAAGRVRGRSQQRAAAARPPASSTRRSCRCDGRRASPTRPGRQVTKEVTLTGDEGIRADTTSRARELKPVMGGIITAGNASQFSDGASACVVMDAQAGREARPEAARHLPRLRRGRLRAGRDGHRPGLRRAQAPRARPAQGRGHRAVGAERGLRRAGASIAATGWASRTSGSTSTAARSPSAIPMA